MSDILADYAVDRVSLGNAGAMLQASGIGTFPALVTALRSGVGSIRGIGPTKIQDLFDHMFELSDRLAAGRQPRLNPVNGHDPGSTDSPAWNIPANETADDSVDVSDLIAGLPISVLQLGVKSEWLRRSGFTTLGDFSGVNLRGLEKISAIGRRTVDLIRERLTGFSSALSEGQIDWNAFASACDAPLIPSEPLSSGADMLSKLPVILEQLGPHLRDDSYRHILFERLTKGPGSQPTLEELGAMATPAVTRERIRQKEKKLLQQLAGALIWDVDGKLGVQFHPTMLALWRLAASEFENDEEIGLEAFVSRLAAVWDADKAQLWANLPFIVAVVTGEPQMPTAYRAGARLDPRLRNLNSETRTLPLRRFRFGKKTAALAEQGIVSLGDLLRAASEGVTTPDLNRSLNEIATTVRSDGTLDWARYASIRSLAILPAIPTTTPHDFSNSFVEVISELLRVSGLSDRYVYTFQHRTSKPVLTRPTLQVIADALKSHGPTTKRMETVLLEELNTVLVQKDFSRLAVWLRGPWLSFIEEAHEIYEGAKPEYEAFRENLSRRWSLEGNEVDASAPGLWAIFTGYPEGRRTRHHPLTNFERLEPVEPAKIRLRGFRRLH